jgi:tRNA threonylcarbamoyl adenosine modification protein YjeE
VRVPFLVARTRSAAETTGLGRHLGGLLRPGEVVLLTGELGTGKTTFVRGLAAGLGVDDRVRSPSFQIVRTHGSGRYPFVHIDLYRLGSATEVLDLGLEELIAPPAVAAIEWGDKASPIAGPDYLELEFAWSDDADDSRSIRFLPSGRWRDRMGELGESVRSWAAAAPDSTAQGN